MREDINDDEIRLLITHKQDPEQSVKVKESDTSVWEDEPDELLIIDDINAEVAILPCSAEEVEKDVKLSMMPTDYASTIPMDKESSLPLEKKPKHSSKKWLILVGILIIGVLIGIVCFFYYHYKNEMRAYDLTNAVFEPEYNVHYSQIVPQTDLLQTSSLNKWIDTFSDKHDLIGCAIKDTIVNDLSVRIYFPLNSKNVGLSVGKRSLHNANVILAFQAADIRADNKQIVGSFVEKGKQLAIGSSKKGFCAIIDGKITIGMAENSSLYEEAIKKNGDFFRQYPLVADFIPQNTELRSQTIRRALCSLGDKVLVIQTLEKASMHDFSLLLADMGVENAIYLVGGSSTGLVVDTDGQRHDIGSERYNFKYINYIYWER